MCFLFLFTHGTGTLPHAASSIKKSLRPVFLGLAVVAAWSFWNGADIVDPVSRLLAESAVGGGRAYLNAKVVS